ncbi:mpv17-like protein 2 [Tribolium madens]|uniref:mpv17-like protein 2 n=1 Tax=Tribolium madens TaxID=41895 RepID=UPI001CF71F81|nr:mpv17-like protein 2 [Tribolium madens]
MLRRGFVILRRFSTAGPKGGPSSRFQYTIRAAFGKYLLVTNTVSSGVLMLLGDVVEQEFHHDFKARGDEPRYDYARLGRMFLVGLGMGPVHHYYYGFINKLWPLRDMVTVSKKILADQIVMSPICIAQFFYTLGLLEQKPVKRINEEFLGKFGAVYTMDWCVWPPTQFINFYLIPCRYQVIYINFVTMIYNVFLSYIKHEY